MAAIFALFMHYGIATTNITPQGWSRPAQHIIKHYQKGDVIGILPTWALQGAEPLRKYPIIYREDFANTDLTRYRRLWLMVAPRLGKWWFRKAFRQQIRSLRQLYWMRKKSTFKKVELYLFQLPKPRVPLYDFTSRRRLQQAEVWLHKPTYDHELIQRLRRARRATLIKKYREAQQFLRRTPAGMLQSFFQPSPATLAERNLKANPICSSNAQERIHYLRRWEPKPGWWRGKGRYFFGRMIQEVGDSPRDCLWAQPKHCEVLHVRYRLVPYRGTLYFGHGIGTATPSKVTPSIPSSGPDVQIGLWIENQLVRRFVVSEKQKWRTYQIPLHQRNISLPPLPSSIAATQRTVSVEFRIQLPDINKDRPGYCFQAKLLP